MKGANSIVVMGVTSSGKSVVGGRLAEELGYPFLEGDQFHPAANIAKMSAGTPLTDEDRWPWLEAMGRGIAAAVKEKGGAVAACSALKKAYRQRLIDASGLPLLFVFLDGSRELIGARMAARAHHFMPPSLLDSQFATLERPTPDENVLRVDVNEDPDAIVREVLGRLNGKTQPPASGELSK